MVHVMYIHGAYPRPVEAHEGRQCPRLLFQRGIAVQGPQRTTARNRGYGVCVVRIRDRVPVRFGELLKRPHALVKSNRIRAETFTVSTWMSSEQNAKRDDSHERSMGSTEDHISENAMTSDVCATRHVEDDCFLLSCHALLFAVPCQTVSNDFKFRKK